MTAYRGKRKTAGRKLLAVLLALIAAAAIAAFRVWRKNGSCGCGADCCGDCLHCGSRCGKSRRRRP